MRRKAVSVCTDSHCVRRLEPSDPYIMLNQSHRQYIDPVERLKRQQELLEKQNQAVAQ